jgi:hypothetical protein
MFGFAKCNQVDRIVCEGRVSCPVRHRDLDVEECTNCEWLDAIEGARIGQGVVHCTPPRSPLSSAVHMRWSAG